MRKVLARVLVLVLLLQFSWIAAAAGCMHEADTNPQHFGHHTHVHKASKADAVDAQGKLVADSDCAVCHMGCGSAPSVDSHWEVADFHHGAPSSREQRHPTASSDTPDRPRWARLA